MVLVPNPRHRQRVARELSDGALVVIKGPGLNSILIGSAVLTMLLAIPDYGLSCAAIALTGAGVAYYGETIRRVSQGPTDEPETGPRRWLSGSLIPKLLVSGLMAAGTVAPLWFLNSGYRHSPHWDLTGRAIAAGAWIVGPILMFWICARTIDDRRMGVLSGSKTLARHPVATLLALVIVPISLLLAEITITLVVYFAGHLPFYALDYMPMPLLAQRKEAPVMYNGIPHYHMIDYRGYPVEMFEQGYINGIRDGYSFVGAMPASLSLPTRAGMDAEEAIGLIGPAYLAVRLLFIMTIVTSLLAGFAIQAHWLGAIPALERKKPPSSLPKASPPATLNPIGS